VNSWKIFPDPVIAKIFEYSRGIPRLINSIAENALIGAYARQQRIVTEDIIEEVATDMRLGVTPAVPLSAAAPLDGQEATVVKRLIELLQAVAASGQAPAGAGNGAKAVNEAVQPATSKPTST
jgi:hypothetical protein